MCRPFFSFVGKRCLKMDFISKKKSLLNPYKNWHCAKKAYYGNKDIRFKISCSTCENYRKLIGTRMDSANLQNNYKIAPQTIRKWLPFYYTYSNNMISVSVNPKTALLMHFATTFWSPKSHLVPNSRHIIFQRKGFKELVKLVAHVVFYSAMHC